MKVFDTRRDDVRAEPASTPLERLAASWLAETGLDSARLAAWDFHDLLFFYKTSIGFHDQPMGATWRKPGQITPGPLFKPCVGPRIPLPEPSAASQAMLRTPFADVLASRRSGRTPGQQPLTLESLSALLDASARVRQVLDDPSYPCPVSLRPSPSGGALHSLELYLLPARCDGLPAGAWRYLPESHALEQLPSRDEALADYLLQNPHAASGFPPPHLQIVFTSRYPRVSQKYAEFAFRLVLQDLGCLYQTISLASTALGLASCILGAIDARRLGDLLQLPLLAEPVVGAMTLSS